VFRQIIDELTAAGGRHEIWLNQLGEPTLHKDVVEFVRYAADRGHRLAMTSNGTRMTEAMAEGLIRSGLREVVFSIDGADQETYERIRVGGSLADVVQNVSAFHRINRSLGSQVKVRIDCIESSLTAGQKTAFHAFWSEGAKVEFIHLSNWSGQMDLPPEFGPPRALPPPPAERYACDLLWTILTIAADGRGMLCCHDYRLRSALPRVQDVGLLGVWKSIGAHRERQTKKDFSQSPCADCFEWRRQPARHVGLYRRAFSRLKRVGSGAREWARRLVRSQSPGGKNHPASTDRASQP
jgi:hypothetical protein